MWGTAGLAAVLIAFSLGLILFTQRTGKYQVAYFLTVTVIFMVGLPMMFFDLGRSPQRHAIDFPSGCTLYSADDKGKGGTPDFPAGNRGIFRRVRFAYYHPEFVTHYETEAKYW